MKGSPGRATDHVKMPWMERCKQMLCVATLCAAKQIGLQSHNLFPPPETYLNPDYSHIGGCTQFGLGCRLSENVQPYVSIKSSLCMIADSR